MFSQFFKDYALKACLGASLALLGYFILLEKDYFDFQTFSFTLLMVLASFCFILALSSRLIFACLLTCFLMICVEWASERKFEITNFGLHAEDIYFYLFSIDNLKFLYEHFYIYLWQIGGLLIGLTLFGTILYRADFTRFSRIKALIGFVVLLMPVFVIPNYLKTVTTNTLMYSGFYNRHIATFYVSLLEAHKQNLEANRRFARLGIAPKPPIPFEAKVENPPHIIFVHQESVFPPAHLSALKYDKSLDAFFKSFDGKTHKLRIETFAGTSWITEFAVQSGLSALDYGTKRQFVFSLTAGKLNDALPQSLKNLGYNTEHYFPMNRDFADYGRFYASIGMEKIVDLEDMGVNSSYMRDSFFYEQGLKGMEAHFKASKAPLYSYIQTMSPHSPYDFIFEKDVKTPQLDLAIPYEMREYLRRLYIAFEDYKAFKAELAKRFPDKRFLLVHYGDHHPFVSRPYVVEENKSIKDKLDPFAQTNSKGMMTYYAMDGINYTPPALPSHDIIDAAYLGTVIIEAAGLPLSPLKKQLRALLDICEGRLYSCKNPKAVDDYYRFFLESGAISP